MLAGSASSCPRSQRAISRVDVRVAEGGNKARIVELARQTAVWPESARIRLFADADLDRLLGVHHLGPITVTDGRDVEGYALHQPILDCLCETGAGEREGDGAQVAEIVRALLRPVGMLRVADGRQRFRLPFQNAFRDGTIKRFFTERRGVYTLRLDAMVDSLLAHMDEPPPKDQVLAALDDETAAFAAVDDWQIVHGKDLVAFLAWYFDVSLAVASGLVILSIATCSHNAREHPNLNETVEWVLQ